MSKEIRMKPKKASISIPMTDDSGMTELTFKDDKRTVVLKLDPESFEKLTAKLCGAFILQNIDDDDSRGFIGMMGGIESSDTEVSDGKDGTYRISDDQRSRGNSDLCFLRSP